MKAFRLRPGVHYAPIDGGVYFSAARATFVLRGPGVLFRVVDTCIPQMEDGTDVDELVAAIGTANARPLVDHLVETLDRRGLLLHLDGLHVPEPEPDERARFPEALAYLEAFRDDPYADFRRIRRARVLLAGPADALAPAARGLLRAGVGQLLVATTEPERLSALASRHPEVRLLLCEESAIPMLVASRRPDAAVIFSEDSFPAETIGRLPARCIAIPARLGKDLAIVGPALDHRENLKGAEHLWSRAATWCRRDGDDLLIRPSGDLLAGALAGQMALDALIGHDPGRVHLVHGPDLSSDSLSPSLSAEYEFDPPIGLPDPPDDPTDPDTGWLDSASQRWAGLFRLSVPGDLPQMPLALTLADGRSPCGDGRAVGFGPDQDASTVAAGLEALRHHAARFDRRPPGNGLPAANGASVERPSVAAAGLDQTRWLLDGALRLLATRPGHEEAVAPLGIDDVEARRLWRALEDHELTPVALSVRQVPGFAWTLVSVRDRRSGALVAAGWGPTAAVGAVAALSAAIATQQVRRTVDPGYGAGTPHGGYLEHLHGPHREQLVAAVAGWLDANGNRLRGQRLRRDPVSGPIGPWCGAVWLDD